MNLHTEKEYVDQSRHHAFRLKMLYKNDVTSYYQLQDYLPFPTFVDERESSNYNYVSPSFFSLGREVEELYVLGKSYLPAISEPTLMKLALKKARLFHKADDFESVCNYLQIMEFHGNATPFFTNKILLDDQLTLNTTLFPSEFHSLSKCLKELIPCGEDSLNQWKRFQTLTKREKQVMKLLADGNDSKQIAELLIISPHSVHAHRRNIYKKLDINKVSEVVKCAIALELM
jgi:DNA-binding CsgD family transcriptional regulator